MPPPLLPKGDIEAVTKRQRTRVIPSGSLALSRSAASAVSIRMRRFRPVTFLRSCGHYSLSLRDGVAADGARTFAREADPATTARNSIVLTFPTRLAKDATGTTAPGWRRRGRKAWRRPARSACSHALPPGVSLTCLRSSRG